MLNIILAPSFFLINFISPPCSYKILEAIDNPRPDPCFLVVVSGDTKSLGADLKPTPLSSIVILI